MSEMMTKQCGRVRKIVAQFVIGLALGMAVFLAPCLVQSAHAATSTGLYSDDDGMAYYSISKIYKGTAVATCYGFSHGSSVYFKGNKAIKNAKSLTKNVATVRTEKLSPRSYVLAVSFKKLGTAKIQYSYSGKKHVAKVRFAKYVNPARVFKLGSVNYAKRFNLAQGGNGDACFADSGSSSISRTARVTIKAKSGWKLDRILLKGSGNDSGYLKAIKNGESITSKTSYVWVRFHNKKSGQSVSLCLYAPYYVE